MALSEQDFAYYRISQDPIKGRIPAGEAEEIIMCSIRCGRSEAEKLRDRSGSTGVDEIAKDLGIIVEHREEQSALDYVYFGLFEAPNKIVIYDNNIEKAAAVLEVLNISSLQGDFPEIVLAHEIFHFLEEQDQTLYTNTKIIDLWSLGRWYTHSSKLICASEIAAMSFAKTLLDLQFDPNILDYVFLAAYDFQKADKVFQKMTKGS
ncbi:MAG: hypothetical protein GX177_00850 [Firmicutes bacterium]|nr:hypothetical protein [Bacillota bacterium]